MLGRAELSLLVRSEVESYSISASSQTFRVNQGPRLIVVCLSLAFLVCYEGVKESKVEIELILTDLLLSKGCLKDVLYTVLALI